MVLPEDYPPAPAPLLDHPADSTTAVPPPPIGTMSVPDGPQSVSALKIYNHYAQLQAQLTADFQRELGNAFGLGAPGGNIPDKLPVVPLPDNYGDKCMDIDEDDDGSEDSEEDEEEKSPLPPQPPVRGGFGGLRGGLGLGRLRMKEALQSNSAGPAPGKGKKKSNKGEKKERVRASKLEFKRLDELFNKHTYDYYLTSTHADAGSGKEDVWEEYVFVVVRKFGMVPGGGGEIHHKYLKTNVDIKSVELRDAVREVFKDVAAIPLREDKPSVNNKLLFNYLPQLEEALGEAEKRGEEKAKLRDHLKLLVDYLNDDFAPTAKVLYPLLNHGEITFDLLWALFLPNTLVYTTCSGTMEQRIIRVTWAEERTDQRGKFFKIDCQYIDYDGSNFGYADAVIEIDEFSNAKRISDLAAFPLAYHDDEARVRERLVERGRQWAKLTGQKYKAYNGIAFYKNKKQGIVRVSTKGRIMVDAQTFRRINANYPHSIVAVPGGKGGKGASEAGGGCEEVDCDDEEEEEEDDINTTPAAMKKVGETKKIPTPERIMRGDSLRYGRGGALKRPQRTYVVGMDGKVKMVNNAPLTGARGNGPKLGELNHSADPSTSDASDSEEDEEDEEDKSDEDKAAALKESELLLTSPTVLGFSFSDKNWLEFAVSSISEIDFDSSAFDSLVLPQTQKLIVKALVETHVSRSLAAAEIEKANKHKNKSKKSKPTDPTAPPPREEGIDDLIRGKGRGLVCVLHGKPGVGKTLTAEGISELLKRPLYMVGAGELGTDPRTLEASLARILDMAHTWGAVLLLDEADVFLEKRGVHDLHRNALVSVFLRGLEYFMGILFLTTNRVETFDPAFQSRIHVGLHYKDLDRKALRQIWKTFLAKVADEEVQNALESANSTISPFNSSSSSSDPTSSTSGNLKPRTICNDDEIDGLCRKSLNGRMIKNAVITAQALAGSMREKMGMKHLKMVLDVAEEFEKDMGGVGFGDRMGVYA